MPQYYDREDFYKLADVEKYLGYKLCKDRKHYLNRNKDKNYYDCLYECTCCRHPYIEYLVQVSGEDYITKKYANEHHKPYFVECPEGPHPCCTCFYMQKGLCRRNLNGHQNMMSNCTFWEEKE